MLPAQCDIILYRGDDFEMMLRLRTGSWDPSQAKYVPGPYIDLTGWTGLAQIRATEDAAAVLAEFTVEVLNQATTKGGVRLLLDDADTQVLAAAAAVWDMQFTDTTGDVTTYLKGKVSLSKDVTR